MVGSARDFSREVALYRFSITVKNSFLSRFALANSIRPAKFAL
jgi:hypothetical protein